MTEPPRLPDDEQVWVAYDALLARCYELDLISQRLAATCADPVAVADYLAWKDGGTSSSPGRGRSPGCR